MWSRKTFCQDFDEQLDYTAKKVWLFIPVMSWTFSFQSPIFGRGEAIALFKKFRKIVLIGKSQGETDLLDAQFGMLQELSRGLFPLI